MSRMMLHQQKGNSNGKKRKLDESVRMEIRKALESEGILREAVAQSSQFLLKQNHYSVLFILREALQSAAPLFNISPGNELILYLKDLRFTSQVSVPADRGHAVFAHTVIHKTNTEYASSVGSLVGNDARNFMNNEVLAGVNATQAWARNTSHNMVTLWPVRTVSADANRRSGFLREDYLFGKGASLGSNTLTTLSRPRAEDSGVSGKRDYTQLVHTVCHKGKESLKIKIRRQNDGKFIFSHDIWVLLRADDESRTISTDDVLKYENTIYCKFSAKE